MTELEHFPQFTLGHTDVNEDYTFANGYGISVIRHIGSYGYKGGLFEVAFLDQNGDIAPHPEILPKAVEGWCDVAEVLSYAQKIANLPRESAIEGKIVPQIEG